MVQDIISRFATATTVSVSTTAVALPATDTAGRHSMLVHNVGSETVYLGDSNVTAAAGIPLAAGKELSFAMLAGAGLYGRTSSGTSDVRVLEGL